MNESVDPAKMGLEKESQETVMLNGNGNAILHKEDKVSVRQPLKWSNIILLSTIHLFGLYGMTLIPSLHGMTFPFAVVYSIFSGLGVTAGAHRLWTHRSYKAKLPLRILLAVTYTSAGMNPLFEWIRDHRVHHKYSETDADPHNAKRGLFFSHVGWLFQKKHPEVIRRGRQMDMSDILADPVVKYQRMFFIPGVLLLTLAIPISVPCYFWNENLLTSIFIAFFRWATMINVIWSVNSFAHLYGYHPYDKNIYPAENKTVSFFALGEGWHNYHHTFPWDYKTSELGFYSLNITTAFIDFMAHIGWAYDRKHASEKLIEQVTRQKGDGTHEKWGHVEEVPEPAEETINAEEKIKGI
ncbi:stearoyl-CoA desaturase 5-like [Periplaneta americana]|uniref:stearoyl-CoA desaturase 5-like n=1 Tax=Periplaneta americana TaxID=6978 RepID=UPI0037E79A47